MKYLPVKELKTCKYKAYQPFKKANYSFMSDRQLKDLLDYKRKVG